MPRGDFVLVTHPDKHPAVDFITRSGVGPFIDTGVDVLLRGTPSQPFKQERVYLAVSTIRNFMQIAGIDGDATSNTVRDAELIARGKIEGLVADYGNDVARLASALAHIVRVAGLDSSGDLGD